MPASLKPLEGCLTRVAPRAAFLVLEKTGAARRAPQFHFSVTSCPVFVVNVMVLLLQSLEIEESIH
jgi:hypothetical protein